jgi:hypothetical protein
MIMEVWCRGKKVSIVSIKRKTRKELRIWWSKLIGNKEKEFIKKVKEKAEWNFK